MMSKYPSAIKRLTLTGATFKGSTENTIEPAYINFFYGNNGSGKTTISRVFRDEPYGELTFSDNSPADNYRIWTFNHDFISEELKMDFMPGVLTLSKNASTTLADIEEKQKKQKSSHEKRKSAETVIGEKRAAKSVLESNFETACWEFAKRYKKVFGGSGDLRSAKLCASRIMRTQPTEYDFDELESLYKTASQKNPKIYGSLSILNLSKLDEIENYSLLGHSIVSSADNQYSRFMQALGATQWVKHGLEHYVNHSENSQRKCPFCQGKLGRLEEQIAACFDGQYAEDCKKLAEYQQKYAQFMDNFITTVEQYINEQIPDGFGDINEYARQLDLIRKTVNANIQRIAVKVETPSEIIALDSTRIYLEKINELINETNKLFAQNDTIVKEQGKNQEDCKEKAWHLLAFEVDSLKQKYIADIAALDAEIMTQQTMFNEANAEWSALKSDIERLAAGMGGTAPTVTEINNLLQKSGFRGFTLKPHKKIPDKYEVIREDGSVAEKLSEGERNFIAFLYFYHLVQGAWKQEDLPKEKIIVIDDPVSSMDSGVLFIVASLVRNLIEDCFCDGTKYKIKQIFLLTHNPYFHKEISHKYTENKPSLIYKSSFYLVKKSEDNVSSIELCVRQNQNPNSDADIENFSPVENSYSALWSGYREVKRPTTLLSVIRQIVEYYFMQLCSYDMVDLRKKVADRIKSDGDESGHRQRVADDILKYIYDDININHDTIGDGIYFAASDTVPQYKEVFKLIFDVVGQEAHYRKMSGEGE